MKLKLDCSMKKFIKFKFFKMQFSQSLISSFASILYQTQSPKNISIYDIASPTSQTLQDFIQKLDNLNKEILCKPGKFQLVNTPILNEDNTWKLFKKILETEENKIDDSADLRFYESFSCYYEENKDREEIADCLKK